MKITFDQSDKAQAFVTSVVLTKSIDRLAAEIDVWKAKRSGDTAVRALKINSLRNERTELYNLREQIDLARRLAGFL